MPEIINYGVFGNGVVTVDDDGFIEMFAVIQASGLYAGAPPAELRIRDLINPDEEEFAKQWCAKLNRKADLPYYLGTVKIKVINNGTKITDEDLIAEGIKPLKKDGEFNGS